MRHAKFGLGTFTETIGQGEGCKVETDFDDAGRKVFLRRLVADA